MAKIYLDRLRIKTGTIDEVAINHWYYPYPPEDTIPNYVDQEDGDIIISDSIFAKLINGVWKSLYNSVDHCQYGPLGPPGPSGMVAPLQPIGNSYIVFTRYKPIYNVNSRYYDGYTIINLIDGRAYEFDSDTEGYIEIPSKRITNG